MTTTNQSDAKRKADEKEAAKTEEDTSKEAPKTDDTTQEAFKGESAGNLDETFIHNPGHMATLGIWEESKEGKKFIEDAKSEKAQSKKK